MDENHGNGMMPRTVNQTSVHASFDARTFHKRYDTLAQAGYRVALSASHSQHKITNRIEIISLPCHASCLASMVLDAWKEMDMARMGAIGRRSGAANRLDESGWHMAAIHRECLS